MHCKLAAPSAAQKAREIEIGSSIETRVDDLSVSEMAKMEYTVANYRPSTVQLQLKTLLPCILDLTPAIEIIGNAF